MQGCEEEGVAEQGQALRGNNPGNRTRKETGAVKNRCGEAAVYCFFFFLIEKLKIQGDGRSGADRDSQQSLLGAVCRCHSAGHGPLQRLKQVPWAQQRP